MMDLSLRSTLTLLVFLVHCDRLRADHHSSPNVLFIAVDDLNNCVLGLNDELQAYTPHLDRLAQRGTLFTNAHCAAPGCNPSRASVMTGISPSTSGVYLNQQDWRECSRLQSVTTLPQHFRQHGYKVMGGGKLYHAANLREEMRGGYIDPRPWHQYFPSKKLQLPDKFVPAGNALNGSNQFYGGRFDWEASPLRDDEMGDAQVVRWAEKQLAQAHDKPLFLAVGLYRPHIPWYTPKKWFDLYPIDEIDLPKDVDDDLKDVPDAGRAMARTTWHDWLVEHDKWDDAVQAYLASVSFADSMIGRLIKALDAGPMAKNTIVILWSDHGYHLGHKRHWEKFALWEQATQVPVLIVQTEQQPFEQRCDRPVSLLDLYPTLIDLCGLTSQSHLEGQSLQHFLVDPLAVSNRVVLTTQDANNHSVRSLHFRYVRYADGSEELYDHRSDRGEKTNLATRAEFKTLKDQMRKHLPKRNATPDPKAPTRAKRSTAKTTEANPEKD